VSLTPGIRIGAYEIVAAIGAGGMGEVYRARDPKLGRDVAIKVLPASVTNDSDRLARFSREAQVLAALSHPNIASIYHVEETPNGSALVMEFVEGETLAERISRGPIPHDEAVPIAKQIAEALEAAHEQGVIHRDLKPANIKVRPDDTVKVLDFGLAKALEPVAGSPAAATMSPTITSPALMTGVGVLLGTAAYMAPEQARGRPADKRSDIWAFGCVLYEMFTGKRAFNGEDVSDTLAAVLRAEPWSALPNTLPPALRMAVQRCLEKDPRRRIGDASTLRFLLTDQAIAGLGVAATARPEQRALWARAIPFVSVAAIAAAVSSGAWWIGRPQPPKQPVVRFSYSLPEDQRFADPFLPEVAISRDGTQIVYVANKRIFLKSTAELNARPITGTEVSASDSIGSPVFSPDGGSIVFWTRSFQPTPGVQLRGSLKKIATTAGIAVDLAATTGLPLGITWDGDSLLVGQQGGVLRVPVGGGTPERIITLKDSEAALHPQRLAGDTVMFTLVTDVPPNVPAVLPEVWDKATIVAQSLVSGARKTLVRDGSDGRYLPTGHLVYAKQGIIVAVPFDVQQLSVTGPIVPVIEGVARTGVDPQNQTGSAQVSISDTGSMIYVPGPAASTQMRDLVIIERTGAVQLLKVPPGTYEYPRVSPDGKQIVVGTDDGRQAHVWIYDLSGTSSMRQLTFQGANRFPIWSADRQRVVFQSDRDGDPSIYVQRADGSTPAERLVKTEPKTNPVPESWSPDGTHLLFTTTQGTTGSLWVFSAQTGKSERFGDVTSNVFIATISPVFSPDGRWVAYVSSTEPTRASAQIFVQPFPPTGIRYLIASGAGDPIWSPNGRELVYYNRLTGQGTAVGITTRPQFAVGNASPLPSARLFPRRLGTNRDFDIFPDGNRFVAAGQAGGKSTDVRELQVVINWFEELKRLVPTK
jgi:serine/threonine-protein kinase